jgi:DNA-binding protein H-NS
MKKTLLWISLAILAGLFVGLLIANGQDKKADPPKYEPTKVQLLELKLAKDDAVIAQDALQASDAFKNYQKAMQDLNAKVEQIKAENKWPKELQVNFQDMTWAMPEPAKAPESPKKVDK